MKHTIYITLLFCTLTAWGQPGGVGGGKNHNYDVARNIETFSAIYKQLDMLYVDSLDPSVTIGVGIRAMLRSLDPYTEYYASDEVQRLKQMLTGKYAGIGAIIKHDLKTARVVVDEPYEGMPAAEAGLVKGDVILAIDDSSMVGRNTQYVSERLRGEPGTTFLLSYERDGKKMKAKITRRAIQLPSVPYYGMLNDSIGYLLLTQFTDECARDVRRGVVEMRQQGMKRFILDLRDNGGGSLQEAIKMVNMFVPKGITIVTTQGKIQRANREYVTEQEPIDTVMPVVVLVNGDTASASEITAGALQDLDRATIVGTRTYGKGLVQQTVELPHNGEMKFTVSKYFIPSGRCIQAVNYKHTGGGYMEHIPDSLTREFRTKNGRIVRDGGGITPDVESKGDSLPNIAYYLDRSGLDSTESVFYYVKDYIRTHKTIAPAREFHLTDAEYADFKARVIASGFKYDRETSHVYDELVKRAKAEGYYEDAKQEFEALKAKLTHSLDRELDANREIISRLIENEIVRAYYYQRGGVECTLNYDPQIRDAVKVLTAE